MRIIFAGGGTAGHLNPALAVARYITAKKPSSEVAFIYTRQGIESKLLKKEPYKTYMMDVEGFSRKITAKNIAVFRKMLAAGSAARKIIEDFKPDIVIGTGGYVSGPILYRAARMGIPTAIHEQNCYPGVTTKLLARVVDRVMLSFEGSRKYFKTHEHKLTLTGNPIREAMLFAKKDESRRRLGIAPDKPLVLSYAGSLGAKRVNECVADFIARHAPSGKIQHIHATGAMGWQWMPGLLRQKGFDPEKHPDIRVVEYIYDMPEAMAAADLVVCRAGASTISELTAQGKPAILIPSPNVAENHQFANAMSLVKEGAAVLIEEKDLSGDALYSEIFKLLAERETLASVGAKAASMAIFDAPERIYGVIRELTEGGEGRRRE